MAAPPPDGFALVKPGQTYFGKQGILYSSGASKETVGAQKICMNVMPMPPGAVAEMLKTPPKCHENFTNIEVAKTEFVKFEISASWKFPQELG